MHAHQESDCQNRHVLTDRMPFRVLSQKEFQVIDLKLLLYERVTGVTTMRTVNLFTLHLFTLQL